MYTWTSEVASGTKQLAGAENERGAGCCLSTSCTTAKAQHGPTGSITHTLHQRKTDIFGWLPVPFSLVYEPIVDLLLFKASLLS